MPVHAAETLPLTEAAASLPSAVESRDGYDRSAFRHWTTGDDPSDGCNTRNEVLLSEAIEPPEVGAGCRLTGGRWWSYYDSRWVTSASNLDIDHMVPLAEAWDSGAYGWSSVRREAYANDQGAEASLVAVTASSNRSKSDQDPAEWMPPTGDVHCRYVVEWVATKLRLGVVGRRHRAGGAERDGGRLRGLVGDVRARRMTCTSLPLLQ